MNALLILGASRVFVVYFLVMSAVSTSVCADQFVLFDETFTFEKKDAVPTKSHLFVYRDKMSPKTPTDWLAPVDYRNGTVHVRMEVIEKPVGDVPTVWSLCYGANQGRDQNYGCVGSPSYTKKGVYEKDVSMNEFWKNDAIVWSEGIRHVSLVIKRAGAGGKTHAHRQPDLSEFFPTKIRVTMVQVSKDDVYDPAEAANEIHASKIFEGEPEMLLEHGAGEGPVWHSSLGLLTSGDGDINRRGLDGSTSVFVKHAGSNGLLFDRQGRLVVCGSKSRRIFRYSIDGSVEILADAFDGHRFNQPNDLSIDSKNRIYFTDPKYGARDEMEMVDGDEKKIEGVYRIDTDQSVTRIITHQVDRPNGLIVTPDDRYLYVADNNNGFGGARKLWRFELSRDGSVDLSSQKMIYDWKTTRGPDGMKLDQAGRLYVAAGLNKPHLPQETADPVSAGIYVFSPKGELVQFVNIPRDETTNCAFGGEDGKTLFVTAGGTLWSIRTTTPGYQIQ